MGSAGQGDRYRIRLGRSDRPTSPLYRINELETGLRDRIVHRLEVQGVLLPARAHFSMWLDPPHYTAFITRCGDEEPGDPTTSPRPYDYFVEVQLSSAARPFRVGRAVDFYHVSKLHERLRDTGFTTEL